MGDRRFGIVLMVAVVVATIAGFGVFNLLRRAQLSAQVSTGTVVTASTDFPEGHVLTKGDVHTTSLPVAIIPAGAFSDIDSVVGRVTRISVFTGEVFVPGRLAPVGAGAGLEVKIAPGKRAMAVKIDEIAGLSGLIQPNSRVDVLVTVSDQSPDSPQRAKLFMSNMRVLSVGSELERGTDGRSQDASTAALEVSPAEAEQLAVASIQGRIQLVLRGYGDSETASTRGASISEMLPRTAEVSTVKTPEPRTVYVPAPAPPPAAAKSAPTPEPKAIDSSIVQVYRGGTVTQQKIERQPLKLRADTVPPAR